MKIDLTDSERGICILAIAKLDVLWSWTMHGQGPWVNASEKEKMTLLEKLGKGLS